MPIRVPIVLTLLFCLVRALSRVGLGSRKKHDKTKPPDTMAVPMHPSGIVVKVVGIGMRDRGHSCKEHRGSAGLDNTRHDEQGLVWW